MPGKAILILVLCLSFLSGKGQVVYESHRYENIYAYLDELANDQVIELNTMAKPYSRKLILEKLQQAAEYRERLNRRQQKALDYYLEDFGFDAPAGTNPLSATANMNVFGKKAPFATSIKPLGLYYKDSLFTISARPIWGVNWLSNGTDQVRHFWGGGTFYAYLGDQLGIYANLRDNSMTEILSQPAYFNQREGGNYKLDIGDREGGDYSEMRGGITYSWKWGSVGLIKDQLQWGNHYHSPTILSGTYPSFATIKLSLSPANWIDFIYFHGWLVSEVIDSSRSYMTLRDDPRKVYRNKFMAANLASIKPYPGIVLSVGNSIIYSDMDFQPAYLIPVMFFKSIDHTINHGVDNQNSQMFGDISLRLVKHLHLYSSIYIDEFSFTRIRDPERHNFYSYKAGFGLSNWPLQNIQLHAAYTLSLPLTYKHRIPSLTFATNRYNLGFYMRDNSSEYYVDLILNPVRGLKLKTSYTLAQHGNEYAYAFDGSHELDEYPVMKDLTWQKESLGMELQYELTTNTYLLVHYAFSHIQGFDAGGIPAEQYLRQFTPGFYRGKLQIITLGFNTGF